ncbi:hypothetical protein GCM10023188_35040 [Pontibacter saemangeumensis]|uniref:Capsule assembly protein Wzi n=1 Tax=Pontibacter saemangeumensis TaxID=1084525 RepID=A0ABP8LZY6_9BACT
MKKIMTAMLAAALALAIGSPAVLAQDTALYKLRLSLSLPDLPQNQDLPYRYPTMQQSLELSNNFYDLGYRGIDLLGDKLIRVDEAGATPGKLLLNKTAKYLLSLGFVRYGSELPITLGIWAHEEFHRAVLGVSGVNATNGNWLLSRWDGTVYGVSDGQLSQLKAHDLKGLLYSYVAGVHAQSLSTQTNLLNDFYHKRIIYKNALYLYNAWYTWHYLRFSTSNASNTVKVDAPPHENLDPVQRDYAGADFTAWAYDMFSPDQPYTTRDPFPNGEGVNRRVGFSDLSPEAQDYLEKQERLSLINFINPAVFFVNSINLGRHVSFNFFGQYVPTHFGNDIGMLLPVRYRKSNLLLGLHTYNNRRQTFGGLEIGLLEKALDKRDRLQGSLVLHAWVQPENQSFFDEKGKAGGAAELNLKYSLGRHFSSFVNVAGKTRGWQAGNPYLNKNVSARVGLNYDLRTY